MVNTTIVKIYSTLGSNVCFEFSATEDNSQRTMLPLETVKTVYPHCRALIYRPINGNGQPAIVPRIICPNSVGNFILMPDQLQGLAVCIPQPPPSPSKDFLLDALAKASINAERMSRMLDESQNSVGDIAGVFGQLLPQQNAGNQLQQDGDGENGNNHHEYVFVDFPTKCCISEPK